MMVVGDFFCFSRNSNSIKGFKRKTIYKSYLFPQFYIFNPPSRSYYD